MANGERRRAMGMQVMRQCFRTLYTPFVPKYLIFNFFNTILITRLIKNLKLFIIFS
jgi:hypothetical protein